MRFADELQAAQVTVLLGDPERAAVIVRRSEVSVVSEESRDALFVANLASPVERAVTTVVTNVRVGSVSEKQLDYCNVALVGSAYKRSRPVGRRLVNVRAFPGQQYHDFDVSFLGSDVQRSRPVVGRSVESRKAVVLPLQSPVRGEHNTINTNVI